MHNRCTDTCTIKLAVCTSVITLFSSHCPFPPPPPPLLPPPLPSPPPPPLRHVKQDQQIAKEEAAPQTHKDYSLKAGEKIQINLGVRPYVGAYGHIDLN